MVSAMPCRIMMLAESTLSSRSRHRSETVSLRRRHSSSMDRHRHSSPNLDRVSNADQTEMVKPRMVLSSDPTVVSAAVAESSVVITPTSGTVTAVEALVVTADTEVMMIFAAVADTGDMPIILHPAVGSLGTILQALTILMEPKSTTLAITLLTIPVRRLARNQDPVTNAAIGAVATVVAGMVSVADGVAAATGRNRSRSSEVMAVTITGCLTIDGRFRMTTAKLIGMMMAAVLVAVVESKWKISRPQKSGLHQKVCSQLNLTVKICIFI